MAENLSLLEQLCYSTVRIECETKEGVIGTGTGFFYNLFENGEEHVPVIITNRHVIEGMSKGKFRMTKSNEEGKPIKDQHSIIDFSVDFEKLWIFHPDSNVDLCAMPIGHLIKTAKEINTTLFYRTFGKLHIPNQEQLNDLDVVEDVLMLGYPNGIWDEYNNMPIIRKGTTATHPNMDYNGKKEFMIDMACFPGSSGSPVVLYNNNGYSTKNGNHFIGGFRIFFMGILYAGPQHTAAGEIHVVNIPNLQKPMTISRIPNNLGIVIKSEKLFDFEEIFKKKFRLQI